jgi:hypothetical protein
MIYFLPVGLLMMFTAVAGWAWWCMARRPEKWARWVDRENDFWRDRGLVSKSLADKMKRWEKGAALKLIAAGTTCLGGIGVMLTTLVLIKAISVQHQKIRLPYNPALHVRPATAPKPKAAAPVTNTSPKR